MFPVIAHADGTATNNPTEGGAFTPDPVGEHSLLSRPHTIAEIEVGVIELPDAPISKGTAGGQTFFGSHIGGRGDAAPSLGLHLLYRGAPEWSIGAGAFFGPNPTSDPQYGVAEGLDRSHSRNYFFAGGEFRYVPIRLQAVEAWIGFSGGGVVIADRFQNNSATPVPSFLGTPSVTVRTEGFSLGVLTGIHWMFAEKWVLGAAARADNWILPSAAACTPIGDCATLTGRVLALDFGISIGYRVPL